MNRKKRRQRVGTPPAERMGNAAAGAVLGAAVAGPVGAVAGAAVGAMIEKGIAPPPRATGQSGPDKGANRPEPQGQRAKTNRKP